ncbi:MAG: GAF domain-containing protein, partial [Spirochaetales bacterium]|nr:GAF domain-containing protein [Spirochaetales bacterium]
MLVPLLPSVPLWSRFFTALFLFLIARFTRVATRRGDVAFLLVAAKILLLRDAATTFLPLLQPALLPVVRVSGEIVVYLILLRWTGRYRRTNHTFIAALVGSSVAVAVFGMSWFSGSSGEVMRRVVIYLTPLFLFASTFVAILRIDRFSYRRAHEVETIKPYLQVALMGQSVLYAAVPLKFAVFESVVAVTALAPFVILSLYTMYYALQEQRERTRSLRRNTRSLFGFLSGVGRSLGSGRDPETILRAAIGTMVAATEADAGVAVISEMGQIRVCAVNGLFPPPVPVPDIVKTKQGALRSFLMSLDITHDTPVWGAALASGTARIIEDAAQEPAFRDHAEDRVLHLRSVLVLPLVVRNEVLGLLSVIRRESSRRFTAVEFDHARTMANFVAVTLDNYYSYRIQREIEIAGEIQNRLQA